MLTCGRLIKFLENIAPFKLAEEWDNCGLLVGDPKTEVAGVLVCLDVSSEVVKEALEKGANVIISHHPLLFNPLKTLRTDSSQGQLLAEIIRHELQIISVHTNYDHTAEGVSTQLALKLGLEAIEVLQPKASEKLFKLAVYVPTAHQVQVREAMGEAGAGHIGNYSHCTFRVAGTGTFLPLEGTNPFMGSLGQLEEVEEYRVETIVPEGKLASVLSAMVKAHPYEEVAYDLFPLANQTSQHGLGRIGSLTSPLKLAQLAQHVKSCLPTTAVRLAGNPHIEISKVAVCGGSGRSLIKNAALAGAQALITGELGHHDAQLALELGICLIDAGHFATEVVSLPFLAAALEKEISAQNNQNIFVAVSGSEKDLWQIV